MIWKIANKFSDFGKSRTIFLILENCDKFSDFEKSRTIFLIGKSFEIAGQ